MKKEAQWIWEDSCLQTTIEQLVPNYDDRQWLEVQNALLTM